MSYRSLTLIGIALFSLGIVSGLYIIPSSNTPVISDNCPPDLNFVRPEQDCESFQNTADKIQNLQDDLRHQVNGYLRTKRADRISVFMRDLDSQKFAYVNESEQFYMASLLKVPLAIAYSRLAELTPDLFSQKIIYNGKTNLDSNQEIQPPQKLTAGSYTVEDLIYRSLAYSDNTSAQLLSESFVSQDYLKKILYTLGISTNTEDLSQTLITARTYAGVFRTLYNSSFLSRAFSNKILSTLAQSSFTEGAGALLPQNIKLSHKFAERSFTDVAGNTIHQLSDCGITYPVDVTQAYSFCIMTEGKNTTDLTSIIQNLSSTIYKGITL